LSRHRIGVVGQTCNRWFSRFLGQYQQRLRLAGENSTATDSYNASGGDLKLIINPNRTIQFVKP
jgi:hypothetical protein